MSTIKKKIKTLLQMIKKSEMEILPGHLAFSLVISLAPILTLFVLASSFFSISTDSLINFMLNNFPKDVSSILIPFVRGSGFDINIGIYLIIGFLIASNGLYSVVIASNTIYKKESSTTLKRRIKALILTLLLVFLFIFILIVLAFGNSIVKLILTLIVDQNVIRSLYQVFVLFKWPIGFIAIFFTINLIYALAPDSPMPSKYTRKGALFTTFSWMFVTAIYSYYVTNVANYDIFYGSLSSIMILMIWIYFLSYVFVLGIALNASSYQVAINNINKDKKVAYNNNDIY